MRIQNIGRAEQDHELDAIRACRDRHRLFVELAVVSRNQAAMFAPLTRVNRPHHQAVDLTMPGKLTAPAIPTHARSACNRTDIPS